MDIDRILEALGNDSRRRILSLLSKKPCYVSEISYALKMAPKAVIEHLEKLERAGIIKSFEEGRRRYYYINENMRLEISITPHIFKANLVKKSTEDLEKIVDEAFKLYREINQISSNIMKNTIKNTLSEIYRNLKYLEEVQNRFSIIQGYLSSRASEIFERFLDEIDRCVENDYEKIVLLGLSKGAKRVSEISEEFGIPYEEVERAIENLKRKGVVDEVKEKGRYELIIKC
jgi:ArsR family transcriptional regulator